MSIFAWLRRQSVCSYSSITIYHLWLEKSDNSRWRWCQGRGGGLCRTTQPLLRGIRRANSREGVNQAPNINLIAASSTSHFWGQESSGSHFWTLWWCLNPAAPVLQGKGQTQNWVKKKTDFNEGQMNQDTLCRSWYISQPKVLSRWLCHGWGLLSTCRALHWAWMGKMREKTAPWPWKTRSSLPEDWDEDTALKGWLELNTESHKITVIGKHLWRSSSPNPVQTLAD